MKSKKEGKQNNKTKDKSVQKIENDLKSVSFFELFKYSNKQEKLMIFFGVIFSILQGFGQPLM